MHRLEAVMVARALCLAAATLATFSATDAGGPPDSMSPIEPIAYASKQDATWEIFRMNPDGSGQTRLTTTGLQARFAVWSHDHRQIAYGIQERTDRGPWNLYVMDADGRNSRKLAEHLAAKSPKGWSPDGSTLVYVAGERDARQIYLVAAKGGTPTQLTHDGVNDDPRLSPDGTQIVFTSTRNGNSDIYLMQADGTHLVRLTDSPARDARPAWSPDGRQVAFCSERDGNREIYLMRVDGTGLTRMTRAGTDEDHPLWSPDGARLAIQVIRGQNYDVDLIELPGGRRVALGNGPEFEGQADWAPDGQSLLLISDRSGTNLLYRATLDGKMTALTDRETLNPDW